MHCLWLSSALLSKLQAPTGWLAWAVLPCKRLGSRVALSALLACVPSAAQTDSCTLAAQLRSAALTEFASLRGAEINLTSKYKFDLRKFETSYRMPGSHSCEITLYDSGTSKLECEWSIAKGLPNRDIAQKTYLDTVRGFLNCVPKDVEMDEYDSEDKKLVQTDLSFSLSDWPKKSWATIGVTSHFFALWWRLQVSYSRSLDK